MKQLILLALILLANLVSISAQKFDTLAYQAVYHEHFQREYYGDSLTLETKIAGLSRAWSEAKFNFSNFDLVPELNWDSVYYAYLPAVMAAPDEDAYYRLLMRFFTELRDGHSLIIPPPSRWEAFQASLPIRTEYIENRVVITSNYSQDTVYDALRVGSVIEAINGQLTEHYNATYISPYVSFSTPQDSIAKLYAYYLTRGSLHEPITLDLVTPTGQPLRKTFPRQLFSSLFPAAEGYSYQLLDEYTALLRINTFNDPAVVAFYDSIFQKLPHTENLIVDLRINGGGNGNNGFELLGYLLDAPFSMGINVFRQYTPPYRAWGDAPDALKVNQWTWKPYKGPTFRGKVAVLIGPSTYSAAEDFVVAFRASGRGITIGQPTGGSTGQPLRFPLPGGGMGFICTKRDMLSDWTDFVGYGIPPEVLITYTYKNFLAEKDEAITAALEYFANGR